MTAAGNIRGRGIRASGLVVALVALVAAGCADDPAGVGPDGPPDGEGPTLDDRLHAELMRHGFTGTIESTLEQRLGRPVNQELAEVGRLLFFDPVLSITRDNSCSGCHGPNSSFNDSESIAIGVDNNGVVGPSRRGPHNLRRAPTLLNAAFYPRLMWDNRFFSRSNSPFDNSADFVFPPPDGRDLSHMEHLLGAQAFTPVINRIEMAGSDFPGGPEAMRAEVARRVDGIEEYRERFSRVYDDVADGGPIRFRHIGAAIAEFLFTLVRADAPVDRYARGDRDALSPTEKRGALLFFGSAQCAECHITQDYANEMFSNFEPVVIGVPQIAPTETNADFDGPGENEDFGFEHQTGDPADRYKFRTSPLRNVALQPTFMHNGAFRCLEDAIRLHLEPERVAREYTTSHLEATLQGTPGPIEPVLDLLNPLIQTQPRISEQEFQQIVAFVRYGLTDPEARPEALRSLVPERVPSGLPVHEFEFEGRSTGTCVL